MLLYAIVFLIARNDFIFALLPAEDRVERLLSLAARSCSASRLQPRNEGSLSADCWVYLRHCHTSLRQFFSCCLHSPPSASVRAGSIIFPRRHTPTQSADSLPVVLFLSCFLYLLCTARKKARLVSSNVPMVPRPHHCRHQ